MRYKEFCNSLDFLARTDGVFLKKFLSCNKAGRNQFRPAIEVYFLMLKYKQNKYLY